MALQDKSSNGNGNGNGNRNWQQWMLNAILSLSVAVGGWMYTSVDSRQQATQKETNEWRTAQMSEQSRQNERIAVLENENKNLRNLLETMDKKLDQLLDERRR